MDKNTESFSYTYCAAEQEEIKRIRQKYLPREEDKMEQLRRLDRAAGQKATVISLIAGVVGTLIMGLGMSCVLVWGEELFIPGVIIGAVGICILSAAYHLYAHVIKKERRRIAPEILRLTDELMK